MRDIGISAGRIAAIGSLGTASAAEVIDCKGLHILPGVMDTQVHFREPGLTHQERSRNRFAQCRDGWCHRCVRNAEHQSAHGDGRSVYGQGKGWSSPHALRLRLLHRRHARECAGSAGARAGAGLSLRVKVFIGSSTGTLLVEDDENLRRIFKVIRRRAAFHAEDEYRLNDRKGLRIEGDARSHPVWRDEIAALMATQRLVNIARETGKRIHVLHISTKEEIEYLRDHKDVASCEATPHHLTLAAPEAYERLGTLAQMNPRCAMRAIAKGSGVVSNRASSMFSDPITPRIRLRKNQRPIRPRHQA